MQSACHLPSTWNSGFTQTRTKSGTSTVCIPYIKTMYTTSLWAKLWLLLREFPYPLLHRGSLVNSNLFSSTLWCSTFYYLTTIFDRYSKVSPWEVCLPPQTLHTEREVYNEAAKFEEFKTWQLVWTQVCDSVMKKILTLGIPDCKYLRST